MNVKEMSNEELVDEFDILASFIYHDMGSLPHERKTYRAIQDELLRRLTALEWISTSERYPEENVPVLACTKEGWITAAKYVYEDGWHWEQLSFGGYLDVPSNYEWDDDYEYTHWRYLPAPPQEE